jgi:hypothetical protein
MQNMVGLSHLIRQRAGLGNINHQTISAADLFVLVA